MEARRNASPNYLRAISLSTDARMINAETQTEFAASAARPMDEESFQLLYHRTATPLRRYLRRILSDPSFADDLLQESYLRFLGAKLSPDMCEEHQKNYLFRIATNLVRDHASKNKAEPLLGEASSPERLAQRIDRQEDLRRVMEKMKPRERQILWLAYVEQFDHNEIAAIVGAKAQSIRPMLWRARANLADMLRGLGFREGKP